MEKIAYLLMNERVSIRKNNIQEKGIITIGRLSKLTDPKVKTLKTFITENALAFLMGKEPIHQFVWGQESHKHSTNRIV